MSKLFYNYSFFFISSTVGEKKTIIVKNKSYNNQRKFFHNLKRGNEQIRPIRILLYAQPLSNMNFYWLAISANGVIQRHS